MMHTLQRSGYHSPRYNKRILVEAGTQIYPPEKSKGAGVLCAEGHVKLSWLIHNQLLLVGKWHDGTPCSKLQAFMVRRDLRKANR